MQKDGERSFPVFRAHVFAIFEPLCFQILFQIHAFNVLCVLTPTTTFCHEPDGPFRLVPPGRRHLFQVFLGQFQDLARTRVISAATESQ